MHTGNKLIMPLAVRLRRDHVPVNYSSAPHKQIISPSNPFKDLHLFQSKSPYIVSDTILD